MNPGSFNNFHIPVPVPYISHPNSIGFYNPAVIQLQKYSHHSDAENYKRHTPQNQIKHLEQNNLKPVAKNCKVQKVKQRGHQCEVCFKYFKQKPVLMTHMKVHSDKKEHFCPECGRAFTYKVNMDVHMRVHSGEKPHKCPHCEKSFSQANSLKYHLSIHTGYKPNLCPVCQKAFVTKANLRDHMISHTNEKPFKCDICGHSFARKVSLRFHYRAHNNYKPYKCKYCDVSYAANSSLVYHNKKHCGPDSRDFKSNHVSSTSSQDDVDFDFLLDTDLLNKEQSKIDDSQGNLQPLVCSICNKTFRFHFMYLKHSQTCFGPATLKYACNDCNHIFNDQLALDHHKNQHKLDSLAAERLHRENMADSSSNSYKSSEENDEILKCPLCEEGFRSKEDVIDHIQQHRFRV